MLWHGEKTEKSFIEQRMNKTNIGKCCYEANVQGLRDFVFLCRNTFYQVIGPTTYSIEQMQEI